MTRDTFSPGGPGKGLSIVYRNGRASYIESVSPPESSGSEPRWYMDASTGTLGYGPTYGEHSYNGYPLNEASAESPALGTEEMEFRVIPLLVPVSGEFSRARHAHEGLWDYWWWAISRARRQSKNWSIRENDLCVLTAGRDGRIILTGARRSDTEGEQSGLDLSVSSTEQSLKRPTEPRK